MANRITANLPARDFAATSAFYGRLGGVVEKNLTTTEGFQRGVVRLGEGRLQFFQIPGESPAPHAHWAEHVALHVPGLRARLPELRAAGVTVTRDLEGGAETDALADGQEQGPARRASAAHRVDLYVGTAAAVDASQDRSVVAWRQGSDAFFPCRQEGATAVVRDYRIARVAAPP